MTTMERWEEIWNVHRRLADRVHRAMSDLRSDVFLEEGPTTYTLEQLHGAHADLERLIKLCALERERAATAALDTPIFHE